MHTQTHTHTHTHHHHHHHHHHHYHHYLLRYLQHHLLYYHFPHLRHDPFHDHIVITTCCATHSVLGLRGWYDEHLWVLARVCHLDTHARSFVDIRYPEGSSPTRLDFVMEQLCDFDGEMTSLCYSNYAGRDAWVEKNMTPALREFDSLLGPDCQFFGGASPSVADFKA
jgi:hypothetical protein